MQRRVKARREWEKMDVANLGIPVTFRRADSRQLRQLRGPDAPPLLDGIIVSLKDPGNAKLQPTSAVPMSKPTGDVHPETRTDSPKNFAALYQCSVRTLMRRIKAKAIRAERIHSKLYRIAVADLPAKLTHKLTQKLTS